jgi:hypothetical protein
LHHLLSSPAPINWVTVIWAMAASACVTIALPHLFIGIRQRRAMANLLFAIATLAVAAIAAAEFAIMSAQTPEQIGRSQQWRHVPVFVLMVVALLFQAANWLFGAA